MKETEKKMKSERKVWIWQLTSGSWKVEYTKYYGRRNGAHLLNGTSANYMNMVLERKIENTMHYCCYYFMTSQSLPVKLMKLNCTIYRDAGPSEKKPTNKCTNGIWYKRHDMPGYVHIVHTSCQISMQLVNWRQWWQRLMRRPEHISHC